MKLSKLEAIAEHSYVTWPQLSRRTCHLVMLTYWWIGLYQDVKAVVHQCAPCSKTKVTFNDMQPVRMSLPIKGLMYRWQCDLFGPYPESGDWNYVYINNYYNNIYFNIYILQLLYCITI